MSAKAKKIINIVVNVVCGVILIFVLILAISMISSKRKNYGNYTEIFGKAYLAVESDSMSSQIDNDNKVGYGNFTKGDLITVKILKDSSAKKSLKEGDIITFRTPNIVSGKWVLNTHRIIAVQDVGDDIVYVTRGDHNPATMTEIVESDLVIGKFIGAKSGAGKIVSFMGSSTGFFVFVVLPTFIIVAIAASNLVVVILKEKKAQTAVVEKAQQEVLADERERIRQELLAEMQMQNQTQPAAESKPEQAETEMAEESAKTEDLPADEPEQAKTETADLSDDKKE